MHANESEPVVFHSLIAAELIAIILIPSHNGLWNSAFNSTFDTDF